MKLLLVGLWALVAGLGVYAHYRDTVGPDCFTDSCVFKRCEEELGRPCTDEDIFGKSCPDDEECDGPCSELPPDHPDYCEQEGIR